MKFLSNILHKLEDSQEPLIYFVLTFFFATTIRTFLEIFFTNDNSLYSFDIFTHYILWYVVLALILIPLFSMSTKTPPNKVARTILPIFIITNIVPIIDRIFSGSYNANNSIGYFDPGIHLHLLSRYFTFFGNFDSIGPTLGIKIEIIIILMLSFYYFWHKTRLILKSIFYTFMVYTIIFFLFIVPFHFSWLGNLFHLKYENSENLFINYYLILILPLALLNLYVNSKEKFRIIISDIRLTRLGYFFLMFLFGSLIALKVYSIPLTLNNIFNAINLVIALIFAFLFSVVTNNMADYKIDQISNKTRPLFHKNIDHSTYKNIGWGMLIAAFFYSLSVSFMSVCLIILFIGLYFLYSMPPFRFKRYLLVSKFFISFNSVLAAFLGFTLFHANLHDFPKNIFIFLLLLALPINFIDIKDYLGDKANKILTLPTFLGLQRSQLLIAIFWFVFYLSSYLIVKNSLILVPAIIMGAHQFYLLTQKDYKENPVFYNFYLSFGFLLFLYFQP